MLQKLADAFELKIPNPVVDFFFCGKEAFEKGEVEPPEDFAFYQKIDEKEVEGIMWLCFGKKAVRGCFSRNYWHK